jgi:AAA+ ATPase superfamily predicted ATPase
MVCGRRRVGKSRLVTEFIREARLPYVYFQAARHASIDEELDLFAQAIAVSTLPQASLAADSRPSSLTAALRLLAAALPADSPAIVVLDELPWLLGSTPGGAGELQRVWDQELSARPVLLLLLGSDLAGMQNLVAPGQPLHGRAVEMILRELSPADVARMTGLAGMDAFDAYLITGGQPLIAQEWECGLSPRAFVEQSFDRSTSALIVSGSRVFDAEFPMETATRDVLTAIGRRGERTYTAICDTAAVASATLDRVLDILTTKHVAAAAEPLSTRTAAKDRRWRVSDPVLRFWLALVEPSLGDVDRGRGDIAVRRFDAVYPAWRSRAIEPIVRSALERLLPDERWPDVTTVGGWWQRRNTLEIDLVGADSRPASAVRFAGTITWRADPPVTADEVTRLAADAAAVPGVGVSTPLVVVCPAGVAPGVTVSRVWTADDLLAAWA